MRTAAQAAASWQVASRRATGKAARMISVAESNIESWKRLYVEGTWTLRDLEEHLEAMLPVFTPEDWARR